MLYVIRKESKKNPTSTYLALCLELNGCVYYLSYDMDVMLRILDCKPSELANLEVDDFIIIKERS